ncbi:MAG: protein kinase, partial [Candidatus Obscuribacterales bacterium]|nr:protein kinase [Candidatus Obscuribacterales bacterium]
MTDLESQSISNRYRLLARLDCGSSRVVHKAHDCVLDKVVAIKTLNDQSPLDQASLARFENEAKVLARVSHPHIAGLMDAGHQNGRPYLVLDYFSGRSLFDFLEERGEISLEKSIYLFVDLCLAVEY